MRQDASPLISVVILTWNSASFVEDCIASLLKDLDRAGVPAEVFVVDNGSRDATCSKLQRMQRDCQEMVIIELEDNLGTTRSRNMALARATGHYVLFLDSDTVVSPGTVSTLLGVMNSDPSVGIVAPRLVYPNGTVQTSCKRLPTAAIKLMKFSRLPFLRQCAEKQELYSPSLYRAQFGAPAEVDYCIAATWLVRRQALENVGLFDEKISYAPEDVDYCLRMWLAGWKVVYSPMTTVVHHARRQSYQDPVLAWQHARLSLIHI